MKRVGVRIVSVAGVLAGCVADRPSVDSAVEKDLPLMGDCTAYQDLWGTPEHHGPIPYLLPQRERAIVSEPAFISLGGESDHLQDGTTLVWYTWEAQTLQGPRFGVVGRLAVTDEDCVWRDAVREK